MKATIKLGLLSALMLGLAGCMDDEPSKGAFIPEKTEPQLYYSPMNRTAADAVKKAIHDREAMLGIKTPQGRSGDIEVKCIMSSRKSRSGESDSMNGFDVIKIITNLAKFPIISNH